MNPLTNKESISVVVGLRPGHTAHWYSKSFGTPVRMGWLYDAFRRAVKTGIIRSKYDGRHTVYFPIEET